jgi:signal transduction histidine kinase
LRGDALPGPALLDRLIRDTAAAAGISGRLTVSGTERALPPEIWLTLYRTAQEALTNTTRHAGRGATAEICLTIATTRSSWSSTTMAPPMPGPAPSAFPAAATA